MRKSTAVLNNSSGQAITEYLLVLIVTVAIILGGIYQLNSAFRSWANNYFGDYLACLLESGELPSIGGLGGDTGVCNQLFKPFSLAEGRPYVGKGVDGSGGGEGGNSRGSAEERGGGKGGGYVAVNRTGGAGGGGAGSRFAMGRFSPSKDTDRMGRRRVRGSTYTGSTDASTPTWAMNGRGRRVPIKRGEMRYDFGTVRDEERKEERQSKISVRKNSENGDSENRRVRVNRKVASQTQVVDDEPMTFGSFLRFLLIAAIIIALVVFFGGQALQIGKSMD